MKKRLAIFAALMMLPIAAPAAQDGTEPMKQRILVVLAHPDDELVIAPALARAARAGHDVTLVYATSGDQGTGVSDYQRGAALGQAREGEARCSADALGIGALKLLRHGDGTLGVAAHAPDSAARKFTRDLAKLLEESKPDIVVTWGPDGGYGHGDHRMVGAIATQLVQGMGQDRPLLLFPGIRTGTLPPIPEMQGWAETDPALLSVRYGYAEADLAAARAATHCHATQFAPEARAQMMDLFHATIWGGAVWLRPGLPAPRPGG